MANESEIWVFSNWKNIGLTDLQVMQWFESKMLHERQLGSVQGGEMQTPAYDVW